MVKVDTKHVVIPADDWCKRRIYLHNFFNKFAIDIYRCMAAYPYGHEIVLDDPSKGTGYVEIGPIPKDMAGKYFNILIGDVSSGRGYMVPIETIHPAEKVVLRENVAI